MYLTRPLGFLGNSDERSLLELQTMNCASHLHTKKALFSGDTGFQQSSIKGFRSRGFDTSRHILEIMEEFCQLRNI